MHNFILFIRRFFNLILFIVLEIFCVFLIQHTETIQGNDIVSSANFVAASVYKQRNDVFYYFSLKNTNDRLIKENAELRNQIDRYRTLDTLKDTLVHRKFTAGDSTKHIVKYADYFYRSAKVINNSTNASDNYITLDRGYKDGIRKNMAVITGSGIVGRVEHVSAHYSSVLSILSSKQKVSAKLKDGTNGYIVWDEKQPDVLVMTDIPQQNEVKKGDSIFTALFSIFSPDVLIGTVIKTEALKKNAMQLIYLKSSTNFHNLQYVYVIENKLGAEKKVLEDSTIKSK